MEFIRKKNKRSHYKNVWFCLHSFQKRLGSEMLQYLPFEEWKHFLTLFERTLFNRFLPFLSLLENSQMVKWRSELISWPSSSDGMDFFSDDTTLWMQGKDQKHGFVTSSWDGNDHDLRTHHPNDNNLDIESMEKGGKKEFFHHWELRHHCFRGEKILHKLQEGRRRDKEWQPIRIPGFQIQTISPEVESNQQSLKIVDWHGSSKKWAISLLEWNRFHIEQRTKKKLLRLIPSLIPILSETLRFLTRDHLIFRNKQDWILLDVKSPKNDWNMGPICSGEHFHWYVHPSCADLLWMTCYAQEETQHLFAWNIHRRNQVVATKYEIALEPMDVHQQRLFSGYFFVQPFTNCVALLYQACHLCLWDKNRKICTCNETAERQSIRAIVFRANVRFVDT